MELVLGYNIFLENPSNTLHRQWDSQNNSAFTNIKLLNLQPCHTTVVGQHVTQASFLVYRLLVKRNLKEREDLGIDGRLVLWLILEKWDGGALTGFIWFR